MASCLRVSAAACENGDGRTWVKDAVIGYAPLEEYFGDPSVK